MLPFVIVPDTHACSSVAALLCAVSALIALISHGDVIIDVIKHGVRPAKNVRAASLNN